MGRVTIHDPAATVPGQRVLSALTRYHYLTIRQLNRLLSYSHESKLLHKYVKRLADAGEISTANVLPKDGYTPGGSEVIVCLPGKGAQRSAVFLTEQHAINDVLIALENYGEYGALSLAAFLHERDLKSRIGRGAIPDGYVAYRLPDGVHGFAIEVDMGTESFNDPYQATTWKKKIEQLVAFGAGPYREYFPYEALTVAVVVKSRRGSSETRLKNLLAWTEEIVKDEPAWFDFFRFTMSDPTAMTPEKFVGGSHWVKILGNGMYESVPLVAL